MRLYEAALTLDPLVDNKIPEGASLQTVRLRTLLTNGVGSTLITTVNAPPTQPLPPLIRGVIV